MRFTILLVWFAVDVLLSLMLLASFPDGGRTLRPAPRTILLVTVLVSWAGSLIFLLAS